MGRSGQAPRSHGRGGLRSAIAEQVNNLPHVRDLLPESWFQIKTLLEGLGTAENFITYDKFQDICANNNIAYEDNQRTLISFLHDLGVVLHFQEDPRLEALGILNPEWVTNGVYRILNSHALFQDRGVLTLPILDEILNLPEYARDKRLFIVDMMKIFELCYDIIPDRTFLVPDLLPKDEPYLGEWNDALTFQYHYTVLPTSVITRFIVRMNESIHRTIWRSGVILKSGDNMALVKSDVEEKKIYRWVNGVENIRRDFLSVIRSQSESIHKTIAKLEVRAKVPIPGRMNVVVDFEHLLKLERKGISQYIPEGMDNPVSVSRLLNGVSTKAERQRGEVTVNIEGNVEGSNLVVGDQNRATDQHD